MKKILFTLSLIVSSIVNSQSITAENFDSEKMNQALLSEFNKFRKERNLDTLIYSKPLHDSVSYPNCLEVSGSGKLYHPVITKRWVENGVKNLIANESKKLFNDNISTSTSGLPAMEYWKTFLDGMLTHLIVMKKWQDMLLKLGNFLLVIKKLRILHF